MHRRQLPLAFECPRSLEEMPARAEGRQRWCEGCRKVVHDLSMYGEDEARKLLRESEGRVCVAYRFDERGAVQFRRTMLDRVSVALASVALLASAGCVGFLQEEIESQEPDVVERSWVVVPDREPEPEPEPPPSPPSPAPVPEAEWSEFSIVEIEQLLADREAPRFVGMGMIDIIELADEDDTAEQKQRRKRQRRLGKPKPAG